MYTQATPTHRHAAAIDHNRNSRDSKYLCLLGCDSDNVMPGEGWLRPCLGNCEVFKNIMGLKNTFYEMSGNDLSDRILYEYDIQLL